MITKTPAFPTSPATVRPARTLWQWKGGCSVNRVQTGIFAQGSRRSNKGRLPYEDTNTSWSGAFQNDVFTGAMGMDLQRLRDARILSSAGCVQMAGITTLHTASVYTSLPPHASRGIMTLPRVSHVGRIHSVPTEYLLFTVETWGRTTPFAPIHRRRANQRFVQPARTAMKARQNVKDVPRTLSRLEQEPPMSPNADV